MSVSKESFICYEAVKESKITEMWNIRKVSFYADIPDDDVIYIQKNYEALAKVHITPVTTRLALVKANEILSEFGDQDSN